MRQEAILPICPKLQMLSPLTLLTLLALGMGAPLLLTGRSVWDEDNTITWPGDVVVCGELGVRGPNRSLSLLAGGGIFTSLDSILSAYNVELDAELGVVVGIPNACDLDEESLHRYLDIQPLEDNAKREEDDRTLLSDTWWRGLYGLSAHEAAVLAAGLVEGEDVKTITQDLLATQTPLPTVACSLCNIVTRGAVRVMEGAQVGATLFHINPSVDPLLPPTGHAPPHVPSTPYASDMYRDLAWGGLLDLGGALLSTVPPFPQCVQGGGHRGPGGSKLCAGLVLSRTAVRGDTLYGAIGADAAILETVRSAKLPGGFGQAAATERWSMGEQDEAGYLLGGIGGGVVGIEAGAGVVIEGRVAADGLEDVWIDRDGERLERQGGGGAGGGVTITSTTVSIRGRGTVSAVGAKGYGDGGSGAGGLVALNGTAEGKYAVAVGPGHGTYQGAPGSVFFSDLDLLLVDGDVSISPESMRPLYTTDRGVVDRSGKDPLVQTRGAMAAITNTQIASNRGSGVGPGNIRLSLGHLRVTGGTLYLLGFSQYSPTNVFAIDDIKVFNGILMPSSANSKTDDIHTKQVLLHNSFMASFWAKILFTFPEEEEEEEEGESVGDNTEATDLSHIRDSRPLALTSPIDIALKLEEDLVGHRRSYIELSVVEGSNPFTNTTATFGTRNFSSSFDIEVKNAKAIVVSACRAGGSTYRLDALGSISVADSSMFCTSSCKLTAGKVQLEATVVETREFEADTSVFVADTSTMFHCGGFCCKSDECRGHGSQRAMTGASHGGLGAPACCISSLMINCHLNNLSDKGDKGPYPDDCGSGGGGYGLGLGGAGGMMFRVFGGTDGFISIDGTVDADGGQGRCNEEMGLCGGGGAGGTIMLMGKSFKGRGRFTARGGDGAAPSYPEVASTLQSVNLPVEAGPHLGGWKVLGGAGSGGRVSLFFSDGLKYQFDIAPGAPCPYCPGKTAGRGTIFMSSIGESGNIATATIGWIVFGCVLAAGAIAFVVFHVHPRGPKHDPEHDEKNPDVVFPADVVRVGSRCIQYDSGTIRSVPATFLQPLVFNELPAVWPVRDVFAPPAVGRDHPKAESGSDNSSSDADGERKGDGDGEGGREGEGEASRLNLNVTFEQDANVSLSLNSPPVGPFAPLPSLNKRLLPIAVGLRSALFASCALALALAAAGACEVNPPLQPLIVSVSCAVGIVWVPLFVVATVAQCGALRCLEHKMGQAAAALPLALWQQRGFNEPASSKGLAQYRALTSSLLKRAEHTLGLMACGAALVLNMHTSRLADTALVGAAIALLGLPLLASVAHRTTHLSVCIGARLAVVRVGLLSVPVVTPWLNEIGGAHSTEEFWLEATELTATTTRRNDEGEVSSLLLH